MRQAGVRSIAEKFLCDPKFTRSRSKRLLSDKYNDERRKLISDKASLDFTPGSVEGFGSVIKLRRQEAAGAVAPWAQASRPSAGSAKVRGDTVHSTSRPGRQHDLGDPLGRLAANRRR